MARPVGRFEYSPSRGATLRSPMHSAKRVIAPRSIPLPRLTALATQNRLARAVTLGRCQLHELPDRPLLIRFAPSLLPAFEGAERYAQKLSGLLPGPSESKPPVSDFVGEGHCCHQCAGSWTLA